MWWPRDDQNHWDLNWIFFRIILFEWFVAFVAVAFDDLVKKRFTLWFDVIIFRPIPWKSKMCVSSTRLCDLLRLGLVLGVACKRLENKRCNKAKKIKHGSCQVQQWNSWVWLGLNFYWILISPRILSLISPIWNLCCQELGGERLHDPTAEEWLETCKKIDPVFVQCKRIPISSSSMCNLYQLVNWAAECQILPKSLAAAWNDSAPQGVFCESPLLSYGYPSASRCRNALVGYQYATSLELKRNTMAKSL